MKPLSPIHPLRAIPPGRYMLDRAGILWPIGARRPDELVAAVTVRLKTDDLRAVSDTGPEMVDRPVGTPVEKLRVSDQPVLAANPPKRPPDAPTWSLARKPRPMYLPAVPAEAETSDEEDAFEDFSRRVTSKQAKRAASGPMKSEPKIDTKSIVAAFRAKPRPVAEKRAPTRRALADGECHRCGTRTTIGCEHFLPFQGGAS